MAIGVKYITLIDIRAVGGEVVVSDFFDFPGPPASGTFTYRMVEVPLDVITPPSITDEIVVREVDPTTHVPTGPVYTKVVAPASPLAGQFQIDETSTSQTNTFKFGKIKFNKLNGGATLEIIYTGRGSLVYAEDVNDPRDELKDSRDVELDLGTRLDKIENGTRILDKAIRARHITDINETFTFPDAVVVEGDLTVTGTFTKLKTELVEIFDNIIELNSNVTSGTPTEDAGIQVKRGSSPIVSLAWDETDDEWALRGSAGSDLLRIPDAGGLILASGDIDHQGDILPNSADTSSLGSATRRYANLFMASTVDYASDLLFSSGSEKARLTTAGRLGIGTVAPSTLLHAGKAVDGSSVLAVFENTQAHSAGSTNETAEIHLGFGGDTDAIKLVAGKVSDYTSSAESFSNLTVFVDTPSGANEIMRMSAGRVSIATAPMTRFTVGGTISGKGGAYILQVDIPTSLTVTPQGTTGSTTWGYRVTALSSVGETLGTTEVTTASGNATLNSTNFNRLTWVSPNGSDTYNIYRTTSGGTPVSTGLIGTVALPALPSFDDTGIAATSGSPPLVNSTVFFGLGTSTPGENLDVSGNARMSGYITLTGSSAPALSPSGSSRIYFDSGNNSLLISENGGAYTGIVSGTGTAGAIAKWDTLSSLTDSIMTEAGTKITLAGNLEQSAVFSGTGSSYQGLAGDTLLAAAAGSSNPVAPKRLAAIMGNLMDNGSPLTATANTLAGVIGAYTVLGAKATTYPSGAVLGEVGDGVTECDGAFVAYTDGDSLQTNAGAALKVRSNNSTAASGFDFGVDLFDAAHDGYQPVSYKKAEIRLLEEACIFTKVGTPVDGSSGTGAGVSGPGSVLVDTSGKKANINTGTKASPTWNQVIDASSTQTLSNKTLTTPVIADFTNATHNHEAAAGGGTVSITAATTGTLTVARGGTGATSVAAGGVLFGASTPAYTQDAANLFWDDASNFFGVGTASPGTAFDLSGALSVREMAAPAVSPADQGRIYFDATANKFRVSESGAGYVDLVPTGGGGPVGGSGTTGKLAKFTGSTTVGDSIATESGTAIGINEASPESTLHVGGSLGHRVKSIAFADSPYTAAAETVIIADASGGAITVNLPAVAGVTDRVYHIKKTDSSANAVTIDASGVETIDGSTTKSFDTQYTSLSIVAGPSEWHIL